MTKFQSIQCMHHAPCKEGCMKRDIQGVSWSLRGVNTPLTVCVDKTLTVSMHLAVLAVARGGLIKASEFI